MSDYRHKRHNVSSLIYHIVCPAKYRRVIFDAEVDAVLKDICLDIAKRYAIVFLEIGTDKDHVHFVGIRLTRDSWVSVMGAFGDSDVP
jgi:putative transposase